MFAEAWLVTRVERRKLRQIIVSEKTKKMRKIMLESVLDFLVLQGWCILEDVELAQVACYH